MTIIAAPSANQVEGTLAASYTRGTDTTITLVDGTLFPSPTPLGHVISIRDTEKVTATTKWCLIIYTSKETHVLTMGGGAADYALAKNVSVGDEAYEWPIGSFVDLLTSADEIYKLFALNDALSPMIVTGGALSTGSTAGTFKVTALTCFLRLTNDEDGKLGKFSLAEQDDQAITAADTTYYVILTYDGDATPTLSHSATRPTDYRSIVIGKVMKTSAPITHVLTTGCRLLSGVEALARRAKDLRGIELASGCEIAWNDDVADNEITIQEGIAYQGIVRITPFSADAFNSNDDDFVYMWRDTGVWQYTTGSKVINALYFDDNTADAGHPGGTLVTGQYGVAWVYIHPSGDHVYVVYGRDSYKLAEAEAAQAPSDIPVILSDFGLLIGRIIIVKSGTTFEAIDMVTDQFFSGSGVGDDPFAIHDNVSGEIVAIAEKTAPIAADEHLIEDSANSNAKASVKYSSLGSAGVALKTTQIETIYVDTGGDDGDMGTSGSPKLTVQGAIDHFKLYFPYIQHACVIAVGKGTFSISDSLDFSGLVIAGSLTVKGMDTSDNKLYAHGLAGSGANTTITLVAGTSYATNFWAGAEIWIRSGTGLGQRRTVISNTDADPCVVTISSGATDWGTNPDNTSNYVISNLAIIDDDGSAGYIVNETAINNLIFYGLGMTEGTVWTMSLSGCLGWVVHHCYIESSTGLGLGIKCGTGSTLTVTFSYLNMLDRALNAFAGVTTFTYNIVRNVSMDNTDDGVECENGGVVIMATSADAKNIFIDWANGMKAATGGLIIGGSSQVNDATDPCTNLTSGSVNDPTYIS